MFSFLLLSSCSGVSQQEEITAPIQVGPTEEITGTSQPTPTVETLEIEEPDSDRIALDFSERPCNASWSNSGEYLPCPGDLAQISEGYANRLEEYFINGGFAGGLPALLTIPAQSESKFGGIFGRYPPFTFKQGDRFRAVLACMDGYPQCDVTYSLEFINSNNVVEKVPGAEWQASYSPGGNYIPVDISLDSLAGRTIQLILTVRDNGNPAEDYALWIQPHIWRPPEHQEHLAIIEEVTVTGSVDFSSAPLYLHDDNPSGVPVAVVLSNAAAPQIFSTTTEGSHPNFSLDVVPGSYYVHAYAPGVGDVPYVSAAYTGQDPSCGQPLDYIVVLPDQPVTDVLINDWNWTCSGTAERFEKPENVQVP